LGSCQRVQLRALIKRRSCDGAEIVAKGFAERGGAFDGAAVFASRIRSG